MRDRHEGERTKGRLKESIGALTGHRGLKREGKVDQGSANVKEKIGDTADAVKDMVNPDRPRTRKGFRRH